MWQYLEGTRIRDVVYLRTAQPAFLADANSAMCKLVLRTILLKLVLEIIATLASWQRHVGPKGAWHKFDGAVTARLVCSHPSRIDNKS